MRDFLGECNNMGVADEDFGRIWCIRCVQQECTRSHLGKSKFEARVSTWEQRLFTDVPRMPETDPRYKSLAAQAFEPGDSWTATAPVQVQVPASWDPPKAQMDLALSGPQPLPQGFVAARVPHQSGKTLGNQQVVIQPGARIRLGGKKEPQGDGSSGV